VGFGRSSITVVAATRVAFNDAVSEKRTTWLIGVVRRGGRWGERPISDAGRRVELGSQCFGERRVGQEFAAELPTITESRYPAVAYAGDVRGSPALVEGDERRTGSRAPRLRRRLCAVYGGTHDRRWRWPAVSLADLVRDCGVPWAGAGGRLCVGSATHCTFCDPFPLGSGARLSRNALIHRDQHHHPFQVMFTRVIDAYVMVGIAAKPLR
jgi:hypothetical protein